MASKERAEVSAKMSSYPARMVPQPFAGMIALAAHGYPHGGASICIMKEPARMIGPWVVCAAPDHDEAGEHLRASLRARAVEAGTSGRLFDELTERRGVALALATVHHCRERQSADVHPLAMPGASLAWLLSDLVPIWPFRITGPACGSFHIPRQMVEPLVLAGGRHRAAG